MNRIAALADTLDYYVTRAGVVLLLAFCFVVALAILAFCAAVVVAPFLA
jgi:hypothetical protein